MDIEHYRIVCFVGQLQSIAAAARVLAVDPSKVSRAVAAVEQHLDIRLFQRTTRQLTVTEEGSAYLRRIGPLIEELDSARQDVSGNVQKPTGTLRMTSSVAFAEVCILPHLPDFHRIYPDITFELVPSDANLDLLVEGIDLAIRLAPAPVGNYVSSRLLHTRYRVCAAPSYLDSCGAIPVPQVLSERNCLLFALPGYRNSWQFRSRTGEVFNVPVQGRTILSNAISLRTAALAGMGPCLLADWLVKTPLLDGGLIDLFPEYECTATSFDTGAWFLYPSRQYLPHKVRSAIDFFRQRIA